MEFSLTRVKAQSDTGATYLPLIKSEPLYDERWILKMPIFELALNLISSVDLPYDLSTGRCSLS